MRHVVLALCAAELLTMVGVFSFPALLPTFLAEWSLTNTEAGWISGVYFAGYAVAVPILVSLTDRIDARRVYIAGTTVAALSAFGFAAAADGFWTAMAFRALGGIGLAGTYMPGLKALVDRIEGPFQARAMSFYTASFSMGTSLSFLVTGLVADWLGWRAAFAICGVLALAAIGLMLLLAPVRPKPPEVPTRLLDFRPVFRNRPAMGYVLGYVAHMWELFSLRSWMVAFLAFAQGLHGTLEGWSPTTVATAASLVAMAASIGGADLATRYDRRKVIAAAMLASAAMAFVMGFSALLPYAAVIVLCLIYNGLVQVDSAALTTGAVQEAEAHRRGATMAVHSLLGFLAAFLGPLAMGMVLDATAGQGVWSWGAGFASVGLVALLGPLALRWSRRLR